MPELDLRRLRPQSQTVSVYTRHSSGCSKTGEPQWRRCKCAKYLYLLKEGTRKNRIFRIRESTGLTGSNPQLERIWP